MLGEPPQPFAADAHLLEQPSLLDGDRQRSGHLAGDVHVYGSKAARAPRPQAEEADQFMLGDEGHIENGAQSLCLQRLKHWWRLGDGKGVFHHVNLPLPK